VNNLPKVVMQHCPGSDLNPHPIDCKSNIIPIAPLCHLLLCNYGHIKGLISCAVYFLKVRVTRCILLCETFE